MFQSSAIMRLHHLFVIQTLLELHKQCNIWYSRLKHKFVFLLNNRLRLNSLRSITSLRQLQHSNNHRDYKPAAYYYRGACDNGGDLFDSSYHQECTRQQQQQQQKNEFGGQFMSDLSRVLLNVGGAATAATTSQSASGSLAIPMHMLLLPLVVHQPRVVSPHDPIGGLQASPKALANNSYSGMKQGQEIYGASSSNNLRHLANNGAQMCPFVVSGRGDGGGAVCGRTTPATFTTAAKATATQLYQTEEPHTRGEGPALNCNLATKSTWASRANNLYATRSGNSSSLALRNPLICFPSTSNEIGHVKYM